MAHDLRLKQAEVHLTYRCDLSCPACDHACFNKRGTMPPDLTEQKFIEILDDMDRLGWERRIHILGGEPTLHRDCERFARLAASRGFTVIFLSNCYTQHSRDIVERVSCIDHVVFKKGTAKLDGARDHYYNPYVFCDPADLGFQRERYCPYTNCGISADQNGCTPCPIGSVLAHYLGRHDVIVPLERLLDPTYVDTSMTVLCEHCGGYLQLDKTFTYDRILNSRHLMERVNGTLMTAFWKRIFSQ